MRVLDLFSGIGGFSLGLERAGMQTVAFCEIEPYAQRVLAKHWPKVPIYDDIRTLTAARLAADGIGIDLICGGFPCQDISCAGKGAGLAGERSGLWSEYARLIGELRPSFVIVENVAALLGRGMDVVLGDLAALGFDAEWHCIPAAAIGAPHRRDRLWIVAYPSRLQPGRPESRAKRERAGARGQSKLMANAEIDGRQPRGASDAPQGPRGREFGRGCIGEAMANTDGRRSQTVQQSEAEGRTKGRARGPRLTFAIQPDRGGWWLTEPDVGRVAHGVPARVDRLKGLGNAVVPQIPEIIGRAILEAAP